MTNWKTLSGRRLRVSLLGLLLLGGVSWGGEADAAEISGTVYNDTNTNSLIDSPDNHLARVTLTLYLDSDMNLIADGGAITTVETNGQGEYKFIGIADGNYLVAETNPAGTTNVIDADGGNPDLISVTVAGEDSEGNNFLDKGLVLHSISGGVFNDTDNSMSVSVGDTGIEEITVTLYLDYNGNSMPDADELIQTTTTGFKGAYLFNQVVDDPAYLVVKTNPTGIAGVSDSDGGSPEQLALALSGANSIDNLFLISGVSLYTISGKVLHDSDETTNFSSGDTGLFGVTVKLYRDFDNDGVADPEELLETQQTALAGLYTFSNLPNRKYLVVETDPSGATTVTDADGGNPDLITVSLSGANATERNFLDRGLSLRAISGRVWLDTNADTVGDLGLAKVTVKLYQDLNTNGIANSEELLATTTTLVDGSYSFANLVNGTYLVVETNLDSATNVSDTQGANDDLISVTLAGSNQGGNNFVDSGLSLHSISGFVYNDKNGDRALNVGDVVIENVTVKAYFDLNGDGVAQDGELSQTVTTNSSGLYSFSGLQSGSYLVVETNPNFSVSVADSQGGNDDLITVALGSADVSGGYFLDFIRTNSGPVLEPISVVDAASIGVTVLGIGIRTQTPAGGFITLNSDGTYQYTPPPGSGSLRETLVFNVNSSGGDNLAYSVDIDSQKGGKTQSGSLLETTVYVGKTLLIPLRAADLDGDPVSYSITSSNSKILARVKTGNPYLKLTVTYPGVGATPGFSGQLLFQLFRDLAPMTVENIAGLAQGGFYDGLKFHRVIAGFVAQGGDPLGTGGGGPGFRFENEFNPALIFSGRGQLAMANTGHDRAIYRNGFNQPPENPDNRVLQEDLQAELYGGLTANSFKGTNGSQFFVTTSSPRSLDFRHTIFGQLVRGFDVLQRIETVPVAGDTPTADVMIEKAEVVANDQDAVLMLSAIGAGKSKVTVTASDGRTNSQKRTFTVEAIADSINSPPFFGSLENQVVPKETQLNFSLTAVDLEFDYPLFNFSVLNNPDPPAEPSFLFGQSGSLVAVKGAAGITGPMEIVFWSTQLDLKSRGFVLDGEAEITDVKRVSVGVGGAAILGEGLQIEGTQNVALAGVSVASFTLGDLSLLPGNFTATINWGDGSTYQSGFDAGSVARDPSRPTANGLVIKGGHTYTRPGNFPVTVVISDANGLNKSVRGLAVISESAALSGMGQRLFTARTLTNRLIATFADATGGKDPSAYEARIDWGDGKASIGKITGFGTGRYSVFGSHTYRDPELFPVTVRIHEKGGLEARDAVVWSLIRASGFSAPQHLPPFSQSHLIGSWDEAFTKTTVGSQTYLSSSLVIINSGNKTSKPATVSFYLSADKVYDKATDQLVKIGSFLKGSLGALPPGGGVRFNFTNGSQDIRLKLPLGDKGTGKNLLAVFNYSDAVAAAEQVGKVLVAGPIPGVVIEPQSPFETSESGGAFNFLISLDTQPTSDVIIGLSSSDTTEGDVSVSSVTFTPGNSQFLGNWNLPQSVTVTGKPEAGIDGGVVYGVLFAPATSSDPATTDPNYKGMAVPPLVLINKEVP